MTKTNLETGLKKETRQRIGRTGWGLVLGMTLLLFLLPSNYVPTGLAPDVWLMVMTITLLLFWLGLFLGVVFLMVRYLPFFQQIQGPLLFLTLFVMGLRTFAYLQALSNLSWLNSQLLIVIPVWILASFGILPLVFGIYLWYQDHSVQLFAITFLVIAWMLVTYVRWHGAEQLLLDIIQINLPAELVSLLCLSQLVFILAPPFFLGHSIRLLYREWIRADMLLATDSSSDTILENTI